MSLPRTFLLTALTLCVVSGAHPAEPKADTARIARLIERLGSKSFDEREAATKELADIGEPALDALGTAAKVDPDAEVRRRARTLVLTIEQQVRDSVPHIFVARAIDEKDSVILVLSVPRVAPKVFEQKVNRGGKDLVRYYTAWTLTTEQWALKVDEKQTKVVTKDGKKVPPGQIRALLKQPRHVAICFADKIDPKALSDFSDTILVVVTRVPKLYSYPPVVETSP